METIKDDFDKYLEEQLKDEEFRKAYEELESLYALIKEEIRYPSSTTSTIFFLYK